MDMMGIGGMADYAAQLAGTQDAGRLAGNAQAAKNDAEMLDACKEFETYLWEQVIKSMKETTKAFSDEEDGNQQVDYFMDTAITDMARQMTEESVQGSGSSLAMQMYEQMKRNQGLNYEQIQALQAAASEAQGTQTAAESGVVSEEV